MSSSKVVAGAAWAWVVLLGVIGWIFFFVGLTGPQDLGAGTMQRFAMMFLLSSCVSAAVAATFHIRCYVVRICSLIRATSALGPTIPEQSRLRGVPRQIEEDEPAR